MSTAKQQRFIAEYLVDLNATQAAIRAGYKKQSAKVTGCRLLTKANIKAAIEARRRTLADKTEVTQERVITELARIAFSNMGEFVDFDPAGVRIKPSSAVDTRCLAEVSETVTQAGGTVKFKLHDKIAALSKLGEHLGTFEPAMRVPDVTLEIRAAAAASANGHSGRAGAGAHVELVIGRNGKR